MSVQVSYKNQFVVYFFLLLTFLIVVELVANFWLYNIYRCDFESNELFKNNDPELNRKICVESLGYEVWAVDERKQDFTNEKVTYEDAKQDFMNEKVIEEESIFYRDRFDFKKIVYQNEYGFRGPEITKEKPENTFRIFTIGASTTFGSGVFDNQTYPFYLQGMYDEIDLDFDVQVINAGVPAIWSADEVKKIKRISPPFGADLFIVYDGGAEVRDHLHRGDPTATATHWKERWIEICELGKMRGFETIITLQPFVGTGNKTLTIHEQSIRDSKNTKEWLEEYPPYAEQLKEISNHCSITADLRGLFDDIKEPLFYDEMHVGYRGNQIIAEKMFELSLPLVMDRTHNVVNDDDLISSGIYNASSDTSKINDNLDSENNGYNLEELYSILQTIFSPYKTPKVIDLIFSDL